MRPLRSLSAESGWFFLEWCFGSGMMLGFWINIVRFVFLSMPRGLSKLPSYSSWRAVRQVCWWPAASLLRLDRAALSDFFHKNHTPRLCRNTMFNTSHSKSRATKGNVIAIIDPGEPAPRECFGSYVPQPQLKEHSHVEVQERPEPTF